MWEGEGSGMKSQMLRCPKIARFSHMAIIRSIFNTTILQMDSKAEVS